jgi:hypothetical protein
MKVCLLVAAAVLLLVPHQRANAFPPVVPNRRSSSVTQLFAATEEEPVKVEVCGFKDCKRNGGGLRLEKLVSTVRLSVCFNLVIEETE